MAKPLHTPPPKKMELVHRNVRLLPGRAVDAVLDGLLVERQDLTAVFAIGVSRGGGYVFFMSSRNVPEALGHLRIVEQAVLESHRCLECGGFHAPAGGEHDPPEPAA